MNKTNRLLVAATLAIALIGNAQAGDYRRHGHDHRPPHHYKYKHHHHHHAPRVVRHHHHDWIAPAAVLTLGGIAIGTAISHLPTAPRPVYGAPPPPTGNWYYCGSSDQYYPYTRACPEGWQAVSPR